jgi:transketolase
LSNLIVVIDYNKLQSITSVQKTLRLEPLADKMRSFGWSVQEVDGHNIAQLQDCLAHVPFEKSHPSCVIAHTVKGKGVSFMENAVLWHYRTARGDEYAAALHELEAGR